jgi:hypothetical protein
MAHTVATRFARAADLVSADLLVNDYGETVGFVDQVSVHPVSVFIVLTDLLGRQSGPYVASVDQPVRIRAVE